MITLHSPQHLRHTGLLDMRGEPPRPLSECPERAEAVLAALRDAGLGAVREAEPHERERYTRIHAPAYVAFLESAWERWRAAGRTESNARPDTFVGVGMRRVEPVDVVGLLGRYCFDATTPFVAGTWDAVRGAADTALTGADLLAAGERAVFAVCRPPGHHAGREECGGYCYLNNAALAAQALRDAGAERVAVLDVDYHHGNGTQAIFYRRADVLTLSIHADPAYEYPYFCGYADERGEAEGAGHHLNLPLPLGTAWPAYAGALATALERVAAFAPDTLVVSLGLDTFAGDPSTHFALTEDDFERMGEAIGGLRLPTLTVLEGGYAVDRIGANTLRYVEGLLA